MVDPRIVSALVAFDEFATVPVDNRPAQLPDGLLFVTLMTIVLSFDEGMVLPSTLTAAYTASAVTVDDEVSVSVTSSMRQLDPSVKRVADVVASRR